MLMLQVRKNHLLAASQSVTADQMSSDAIEQMLMSVPPLAGGWEGHCNTSCVKARQHLQERIA
jgi:hypothetical protein